MSNTKSSNQTAVPEAKGALDRFKFEVANELGVPLTDGYNGNLTSKQNGSVGGYMVKKIVSEQPLNFNSIFYIIPRAIVNYRTTFPGISLLVFGSNAHFLFRMVLFGFPHKLLITLVSFFLKAKSPQHSRQIRGDTAMYNVHCRYPL